MADTLGSCICFFYNQDTITPHLTWRNSCSYLCYHSSYGCLLFVQCCIDQISFINAIFSGRLSPEELSERRLGSNRNLIANGTGLVLSRDFVYVKIQCDFPAVVSSPVLGLVVNIFSATRFNIIGIGAFRLTAGFMNRVSYVTL